ncbi:MAG: hypothetical protein ACFFCZ_16355 [Promethearchaeota archaeon]
MIVRRRLLTALICLGITVSGVLSLLVGLTPSFASTWMCFYNGAASDIAATKGIDEFVIVGNIEGNQVLGIDARGTVVWRHSFDSPVSPHKVVSSANGGLLVVGIIIGSQSTDLYLCHFDAQRQIVWEQTYGHEEDPAYYQIIDPLVIPTADGGFFVATFEIGKHRVGAWLMRLDSNGLLLWNVSSAESLALYDIFPFALLELTKREFALAGALYHDQDALLLHIDQNGTVLWNHTYGGLAFDRISSMLQTSEGDFVLAGETSSFGAGDTDAWLIRTDPEGAPRWNRTYGGSKAEVISSLVQTFNGDFILAGHTDSFGAGDTDAWLIRTDPEGAPRWNQTYGGLNADYVSTVLQAADGGFVLAGTTSSFGVGSSSAWVFKTDSLGQLSQTPDLAGLLMLTGWGMSLGGALGLGITIADRILTSRKAKEHPPTNSEDTDSQVP